MATRKSPVKKKAILKEPKIEFMWIGEGDEYAHGPFRTLATAKKDAKDEIENNYYDHGYSVKINFYQLVHTVKYEVAVEEIPVSTFKAVVTVKEKN